VKSEKLALVRTNGGRYSAFGEDAQAAREAIVDQWLKR
jgi:hypothetical protein